jgi:cytochrome c biogenesis protein CcdA/thiol-disulfide isomerase/thioredoxin
VIVLIGFALVAGAGTAITPCVLPILPGLLSAGAAGGRRRPAGIVAGLVATFTATIAGVASVVDGVGLGSSGTRDLAIAVLAGFGIALLVPALGDRIEAPLSRLGRLGPRSGGSGFWSGLAVGGALGFVTAPCAGPILAAVISVASTQGSSARVVALALAYSSGLGAVLGLYALGGRRVIGALRRAGRGPAVQQALGAVLVATAAVMALNLDVRFETALASHAPSFLVDPTHGVESSRAVERRLASLRGAPRFADSTQARPASLPHLGLAPDFVGTQRWFNTGGRALHLADLRGRVVLVDFWTYTCINCVRTLPFLRALDARYRRDGLEIVGVHTPEFQFEHDAGNVARAIGVDGLRYPVVQDNRYATWDAYGNAYWPAEYLIDARGQVRYVHFGEGDEERTDAAVRALLAEAGASRLGAPAGPRGIVPSAQLATPETYVGLARAEGFLPGRPRPGMATYPPYAGALPLSRFALGGTWRETQESATAVRDARIDAEFQAARVYLVLSSAGGRPRTVRVLLDGRPYRTVPVRAQTLYELVSLPRAEIRRLTVRVDPGLSAFAFTFG